MADRPNLRVVQGGKCPPELRRGVERAMDFRLRAISKELSVFADTASFDLDDDDLFKELASAAATVHLARLALARRALG